MTKSLMNILHAEANTAAKVRMSDLDKMPSSLPCLMGWKDRGSHYMGICDFMIDYFGLEKRDKLLGRNDREINGLNEFADHFINCDQFAMNVKPVSFIETVRKADNTLTDVIVTKTPIFDNSFDKVVGVFFTGMPANLLKQPVRFATKHQPAIIISGSHYVFEIAKQQIELTQKESRVLYYYLRGRTSKEIAEHLFLSRRTVEDHISLIKYKLNLELRSEIIDFAIESGLFDFVPYSEFDKK